MNRALVTDRATGEVVAVVEGASGAGPEDTAGPALHSRPDRGAIVLPTLQGAAGPSPVARTPVEVVLDGWRFEFEVEDADRAALRARAGSSRNAGSARGPTDVRAIIPGRVLAVAVVPGDTVTAGQQLLTIEAMKMQNELRAPRDGIVERVAATPGATVEPGDILLVLA